MKYINSYLSKVASADLQPLVCQSNNPMKEISESMGALKNLLPFIENKTENFLCIGDGSLGITGAMLSFFTKGSAFVIDPLVNMTKVTSWGKDKNVHRLYYFKSTYQDFVKDKLKDYLLSSERYSIILVHSHVNTADIMRLFPNWNYCYVNPCCKPDTQKLTIEFQKQNNISTVLSGIDTNILSEKNEVFVYKNENK